MTSVSAALLASLAVLLWPSSRRSGKRAAAQILGGASVSGSDGAPAGPPRGDGPEGCGPGGASRTDVSPASVWRSDPAALYRARRARRRQGQAETVALDLLDAIAPALRAGLSPQRSFELAAQVGAGSMPEGYRPALGLDEPGETAADIWERWARQARSDDLAFVASAWRLSETVGAPLAEAVDRAASQLRSGLSRRRRLAAAIAGPRATVTVLTVLPLSGPVFGLACGLSPGAMYLSTGLATGSALLGGALILLGRWWCTRIVRAAGAS